MNHELKSTILLDIDGVIFPAHYDKTPLSDNENSHLERVYLNEYEFYHPEIVDALAEVALESTILLASSRQTGFLTPYYSEITGKLGIEAALRIDPYTPARVDLKYDAVHRFVYNLDDTDLDVLERGRGRMITAGGVALPIVTQRALWIDDHIATQGYFYHERIATLVPVSAIGLTMADVEKIEAWV